MTFAEIRYGIEMVGDLIRRAELNDWLAPCGTHSRAGAESWPHTDGGRPRMDCAFKTRVRGHHCCH